MITPLNIPLYFVLNKTNANISRSLRKALGDTSGIIGEFSHDPGIFEAGLKGRVFLTGTPAAEAVLAKIEEDRLGDSSFT
jgi:hypothetical protein